MRNLKKAALITAASLAVLVPAALADTTTFTINANVEEFVVLQVETTGNVIVSKDDMDPMPGSPATNEVLNFGNVDPLAISPGTFTALNAASGTLAKQLLVSGVVEDETTFSGTMAPTDGAIYYINGGYQLRGLRNDGGGATMNVDVQATGSLDAIVSPQAGNAFNDGDTLAGRQTVGGAPATLFATMALNSANIIDLGIVVPLTGTTPGAQSTVITFTGT